MNVLVKNRSVLNSIKKFLRYRHLLTFLYRVIFIKTFIYFFDRKSPRGGSISKNGFHYEKISKKSIKDIEEYPQQSLINRDLSSEKLYYALSEIFGKFKDVIIEYLGNDAKIDGIRIIKTSAEDSNKNISANWHTDNVGIRLKLFICFDGDGSQPTYIINNKNQNINRILFDYYYEVKRWIGKTNKIINKNQIGLNHLTGSAYVFDTNNLHRGSFEKATSDRKILMFEFSRSEKHKFLKNAPIGTKKEYNNFRISKKYCNISDFNFFIDPKRVNEEGNYINYL